MNHSSFVFKKLALFAAFVLVLQSCIFIGDQAGVSPRGAGDQEFKLNNFDGLDMGNAFNVKVKRANTYSIIAHGDQSDLDDLEAYINRDGDLVVRYRHTRLKRYRMDIDISMPTLAFVNFSGAVRGTIDGFEGLKSLELNLSGASSTTFMGSSDKVRIDLSGASDITLKGKGSIINGQLSGASRFEAADYVIEDADLDLSGASFVRLNVRKTLRVSASGASTVRYRGMPDIRQNLSGGSSIKAE